MAYNLNRVIGFNGVIPWHTPEDLARFETLTINNVAIMGRKTYESIGRPLVGRINIVITGQRDYNPNACIVACSFKDALEKSKVYAKKNVFIIGGESIYKEAINANIIDIYYLTHILANSSGDAFMPSTPDLSNHVEQLSPILTSLSGRTQYQHKTYTKIKS